jgi:hypothetical protein
MADRTIEVQGKKVPFVWGHVYAVIEVGPYSIVKYRPNKSANADPDWKPKTSFHPYVKNNTKAGVYDTGHSYGSLDAALIACVVFKREWETHGINTALNEQLTSYIMRILDPEEGEDE